MSEISFITLVSFISLRLPWEMELSVRQYKQARKSTQSNYHDFSFSPLLVCYIFAKHYNGEGGETTRFRIDAVHIITNVVNTDFMCT